MKTLLRSLLVLGASQAALFSQSQVQWNALGDYRLSPTSPATGPRSFTIGPNYLTNAHLNVRSDLMNGGNQTSELIHVVAPAGFDNNLRFYTSGTGAGQQRGRLFSLAGFTHFNIDAPNGHLHLWANGFHRVRLNGNVTGPIGPTPALEFPNINRDGFLVLSGTEDVFTNAGSRAPFTRLHLVDNAANPTSPVVYAQQHGFRPWQRNGITFTGNSDQSYIGHKYGTDDNTDFVVQWSDNPSGSPWGTDRMKFVFTTQYDPTQTRGATSVYGLEAIRLWPRNHQEVFVGIGDFFAGNQLTPATVVDPTERLDILRGRLRIRQLPDDQAATDSFYVMVVDRTALTAANQQRGVVKWVDPSVFGGGGADCDWVMQDQFPNTPPHVSNTYNGSACAWDRRHGVGIGEQLPKFKLHVTHTSDALLSPTAIMGASMFNVPQSTTSLQGVLGRASSVNPSAQLQTQRAFGVVGEALGSRSTVGVYGLADIYGAQGGGNATETYGVMGRAVANGNSDHVVGVYGYGAGATDPQNDWAGWFDGNVNIEGDIYLYTTYFASDASLKTDVQDLDPSTEMVEALQVHSYQFTDEAVSNLGMPEGAQVGLIAQEVEQVLPGLVKDHNVPAKYDTTGTVTQEAYSYKAVNYVGVIPYLISAMQKLSADNQELRELVNACCASPNDDGTRSTTNGATDEGSITPAQERLLRIAPNPFTDRTTLYYTLERAGRAQLLANSSDGRDLFVLSEAQREAGDYQHVWSTEDLAPGMYHITLLLDGEPVVKRAVKVGR